MTKDWRKNSSILIMIFNIIIIIMYQTGKKLHPPPKNKIQPPKFYSKQIDFTIFQILLIPLPYYNPTPTQNVVFININ